MTEITPDQERREAAARSAGAKFQAFLEGLTPDEGLVFATALQPVLAGADEATGDVAGYMTAAQMAAGKLLIGLAYAELRAWNMARGYMGLPPERW